ncbi:MAG: nucleotide sugar dehydrogenase, partial [Smithella sp.]
DLENPDRVLIGSRETKNGLKARAELIEIYANWIPKEKIITSNIWSSELSKLVANAFLAQRVSSINSISALCEKADADVVEVARAVGMDSRVGSKFLNAGIGFGGSCFKKDILNLVYLCNFYGLHDVANYWESVVTINEYQQERFITNILSSLFNTLAGKKICILGFAFKANTGDTRESPAINITRRLLAEHAEVVISDPKALKNAALDLEEEKENLSFEEDPYRAATGCHALAILTEWDLFKNLDYKKIYKSMVKPAFLFDGRNIIDHSKCFEIGFNVYPIGKPAMSHFK